MPIDPERMTMYVCGPTVYDRAHIGNARPAVVFDALARLMRHEYRRRTASSMRATSPTSTTRSSPRPQAEGVDPSVITERYERFYLEDMGALGVAAADDRAARHRKSRR